MIEINLLPRDYLKRQSLLSFGGAGKYAIAAVAAVAVVLTGITLYQMNQLGQLESNIERANQRAAMLRQDIQLVDALTDVKDKITLRMAAVERLDRHRSAWVRILEDLARNLPEFIWLGTFRQTDIAEATGDATRGGDQAQDTVTVAPSGPPSVRPAEIAGYAFTLNSLAAFMIKMMRSDYFDDVELVSTDEVIFDEEGRASTSDDLSQDSKERAYNFVLTCNVHYLSEEELRNLIAAAEGTVPSEAENASHQPLN